MNLVIIEGAGKKDTISKYLGNNYKVFATKGHVRDLPIKKMGVDIVGDFSPNYEIMSDKLNIIKELKKLADKADNIYLAADPDREGEAIAWHIAHILEIPKEKKCRVVFNEISKPAIEHAIKNPRIIDQDIVDSQQARRVLDRLVGYKLSPIVSKKIKPRLSAGRVQSVALKILTERENEISKFKPEEYWLIKSALRKEKSKSVFFAILDKRKNRKIKLKNKEEVDNFLNEIKNEPFIVEKVTKKTTKGQPYAPFITSTLQQDALNKLGMDLKKTSFIAQNLYEGVKLEKGKTALVTYIRTDSTRVSADTIKEARSLILCEYGEKYLPKNNKIYSSKKSAQDAHEAIRPINIEITPEKIKDYVTNDQYRLYKLIYNRFIASQMNPAIFDNVTAEIKCSNYMFKLSGKTINFDGFMRIYKTYNTKLDEGKDEDEQSIIPNLVEGEKLELKEVTTEQKFTKPPSRFTEAMLIKTMEKSGIGRPATYSPTITTLAYRKYTTKEGRKLIPTDLGMRVSELLEKHFSGIVNIDFTARLENKLDKIAHEKIDWKKDVISTFYVWFEKYLKKAGDDNSDELKIKPEKTDIKCTKCGEMMYLREGRYGKFLGCSAFPKCKNIQPLKKDKPKTVGKCPNCKNDLLERKSKKGKIFYGCSTYPDCDFTSFGIPIEKPCPDCSKALVKKEYKNKIVTYCTNKECKYKNEEIIDKQ